MRQGHVQFTLDTFDDDTSVVDSVVDGLGRDVDALGDVAEELLEGEDEEGGRELREAEDGALGLHGQDLEEEVDVLDAGFSWIIGEHLLLAMGADFVVAGLFATRRADAAHGRTQGRPRAAHVQADLVQAVEGLLDVFGGAALEHDVTGLAVEGDQAGTVLLPDVTYFAQKI